MHWASIGEAGFVGGMRFLFGVYRLCGPWPFRGLLFFVILWFFVRRRVARRASLEYLRRLYETSGGATPPPTLWNSFRHFLSFAETILDKLRAHDAQLDAMPYHAEGAEALLALIPEKRGALMITAHLGNLELCRHLTRNRPHMRLTVLVHTRHAERFNQMLRALNPEEDIDLIQVETFDPVTAMRLSERIAAGGFVVIAGDRVPVRLAEKGAKPSPNNRSEAATLAHPFLGAEAHFPIGPYLLAAALGCPVFTLFSARHADGFSITLRPLAERIVLPRSQKNLHHEAIAPYLRDYVAALSEECQKHPLQWFNFFPFWQALNENAPETK
ncbi:MAG: acyltransferase [Zoogloeaceae bacterium]|jgi:predicted LPLAT superfamily acyltransferase|nr:acyltransferase [Zoogloeaceae bacterium]